MPDTGGYEAPTISIASRTSLGGRVVANALRRCLVIDRRYEADRWHGASRIGDCDSTTTVCGCSIRVRRASRAGADRAMADDAPDVFFDLETTGLSGGAGTLAFLVGCGWFERGAFQVRQFLLTSHAAERALLAALAESSTTPPARHLQRQDVRRAGDGDALGCSIACEMPLDGVPHFDMLHPARRLWRGRAGMRTRRRRAAG